MILRENGATTIVQIKASETIRELVERVLEKRGFAYQAYEVFLSGTNKVRLTLMRISIIALSASLKIFLLRELSKKLSD